MDSQHQEKGAEKYLQIAEKSSEQSETVDKGD
jgi:hypothetical protein